MAAKVIGSIPVSLISFLLWLKTGLHRRKNRLKMCAQVSYVSLSFDLNFLDIFDYHAGRLRRTWEKLCTQKGALHVKHACRKLRNFATMAVNADVDSFT